MFSTTAKILFSECNLLGFVNCNAPEVYRRKVVFRNVFIILIDCGVIFQHNNPYIMAMVNDGTKQYEHQK